MKDAAVDKKMTGMVVGITMMTMTRRKKEDVVSANVDAVKKRRKRKRENAGDVDASEKTMKTSHVRKTVTGEVDTGIITMTVMMMTALK